MNAWREARKVFFFEKKKQKTFIRKKSGEAHQSRSGIEFGRFAQWSDHRAKRPDKSFLVLFFKKGHLPNPYAGSLMRVAVYYAPAQADPLCTRAADWLGRDPETNSPRPQPNLPDIATITSDARQYGFHCTLKPPMHLRPGTTWEALLEAATQLAATIPAFPLPPLAVEDLHGFLALRETRPCPEIQSLADAFVSGLDPFRAPPTESELARRRQSRLTPAQDANLLRWGYPHVFDTWFFHMTLTRRLTLEERALYHPAAQTFFAPVLAEPRAVRDVCLFTQAAPGAPFSLAARLPLQS